MKVYVLEEDNEGDAYFYWTEEQGIYAKKEDAEKARLALIEDYPEKLREYRARSLAVREVEVQ
jgi:hypothetical protein